MAPEWRKVNLICSLDADGDGIDGRAAADAADAAGPARAVRARRAGEVPHRRRARRARRRMPPKERRDEHELRRRSSGSGGATPTAASCSDYTVEVNEGEVVLDIIHRLQATQAGDLAVRWNCKAGKCGSCSAEINGRPRLMCMTRMSTFTEDETDHRHADAHVPGDQGPGHRRLVQLREGPRDPGVRAAGRARAGRVPDGSRSTSSARRSSASASSASCARTSAT